MARLTLVVVGLALVAGCSGEPSTDALELSAAREPAPTDAPAAATTTSNAPTSSPPTSRAPATSTTSPSTTTSTIGTTTTTTSTTSTTTSTTTTTVPGPPMTSCEQVIHIGDSTGVYLWEAQYVGGDEANTMRERYRSVGVEAVFDDNSGGRSIEERTADWQTTAFEVAVAAREGGFEGCWVLMIGTNDAAAITAGSRMDAVERILRMLYVIGDEPVLWVDAVTDGWVSSSYRNESMQAWNNVLWWIASERPNVEVLRWSERVVTDWFTADGIHYTSDGHAWRAAITALALAEAFPA